MKKNDRLIYPWFANLDTSRVYVKVFRSVTAPLPRTSRHRAPYKYQDSFLRHTPSVTTLPHDLPTNRFPWLSLVALALGCVAPAMADYQESFESAQPTWRLADSDCGARVAAQRRDYQEFRAGQASEQLSLVANQGTYAYLVHPIPQARVLAEWTAGLWLKADRTGLQLLARVVLPRSRDPQTGAPLTVLLRGDVYDRPGLWQQLTIQQVEQVLERQVRVLRSQVGPDVDPREAYADLLVVNAYGGSGVTNLWIDELQSLNHIAPTRLAARSSEAVGGVASDSQPPEAAWPPAPGSDIAHLNGSILLVEGRPFFPRAIEHNGESFAWLQGLGFNTLRLPSAPTVVQLREAASLGLWLIAPPPNDGQITADHARVIAWDLGYRLGSERLELTRQWAAQLRRSDPQPNRPLVGEPSERLWSYSRLLSILVARRAPLGTSCSLPEYGRWLQSRPAIARAGTPFWATVQTEPALELVDQWSALGLGLPQPIPVEPEQIRVLAFQALASGVRGLIFSSRTPLDQADDETQTRARLLQRLNVELTLVEPWVAGGSRGEDAESPAPEVRISSLQTERSQLFLVLEQSDTQQFTIGPVSSSTLSVVLPSTATSPQIYCLTPAGLQTLSHRRVPGGVRVSFERYGPVCLVAMTQDPLVVNHLARTWAENRTPAAKLQYELAAGQLQAVETLHSQLVGQSPGGSAADQWLNQARDHLRHCQVLLGSSDYPAAQVLAEKTLDRLALVRHSDWEQAVREFAAPSASPFCAAYAALPLHGEIARRLQAAPAWSANSLAAGDFENLDHLRATGWQNLSHTGEAVRTWVELSPQSPGDTGTSLRLQATAADPQSPPAALEKPPLQIISPPIPVRRGQLVRIGGWVRVAEPITASADGLLIYDSLGGPLLGQRFPGTDGWQEFSFYRVAATDSGLSLTIALTGLGEAAVDDLSVSLHDPIAPQGGWDEARRLPPTGDWYR